MSYRGITCHRTSHAYRHTVVRLYRHLIPEALGAMASGQKAAIIFPMGFPEWTLWGMGLSIAGALVALSLSLLGQSPGALKRVGLGGSRLELRIRALTGYALALLLLAIGFFIAGVPLGPQASRDSLSAQLTPPPVASGDNEVAGAAVPTESVGAPPSPESTPTAATPETGAFGGPPAGTITATAPAITATVSTDGSTSPTTSVAGEDSTATTSPTATPTSTSTPTPEATPTPSLTPTPIAGDTAVVSTGGSTIWLLRSPGGQNLTLMHDADIVILHSGHANQGGTLWREISALSGIRGWIQEEFLVISG